jgi:radical SAM protein with 4Fe4S-binding SPASM domain
MKLYYKDTFNFISKITFGRLFNAFKILISYYITRLLKRPIQWGLPMTISIEPTTACNLRCPECPSGLRAFSRETGNLKSNFFINIIDQLHSKLIYLIFYFQGEPYINPEFLDMVKYASDKGIYTITSTNGHFLNDANAKKTIESGLDRVIISVDGTTQEVYENYRKEGKLESVLQGARNLVKWKKEMKSATPHIIFQFLVVKPNEHQIPDIYKLAEEIGVDEVKLKTAQVYDYENGNELIPTIEKYSRYKSNGDGTYSIKSTLLNHCWKLWHACVITWDGLVVPCCFDKDATHQLGDLKSNNFKEIWQDGPYQDFRRQLLGGRDKIDICTNCTEGCEVWKS